jgi:hypothetical protein
MSLDIYIKPGSFEGESEAIALPNITFSVKR